MVSASKGPLAVVKGFLEVEEALGDFIAGPDKGGLAGHVQGGYQKRCDQFANLPPWALAIADGGGGPLGRICQPYWDEGGYTGPSNQPPFTGGQCAAVFYRITWSERAPGFNPPPNEAIREGPLTYSTAKTPAEQQLTCGEGGPTYNIVRIFSPSGGLGLASGCGAFVENLQIVRVDGQPDTCGDPPGDLKPGPNPPPNPGPTPGPEPTNDPSNPTGPPLLPIPDYEDPIGGPTPIEGPDPYAPTLPTSPTGGNPDSQPGGPENVGEPIEVDPGPGGGGGGTDFGPPPPGRAWIGAFLQFAIPEQYSSIPGSSPGNKVISRIFGNASLVFAGGLSAAHRVNSANMSLFREHGALQVTGVYVNCLPGITYTVSPVSVELEVQEV